ncbi:NAD(P)/FAD-dependent oxidoreductase [Nonlabens xiamenensis]|uniref:NAD(P)/FAD-dependent oxidoreductase n=1 Tax=Nonlabens xiamenensis TaxID=2341043 RepID=UPI000F610433|nr:NAD(P)/FAD-dependent oxidoreductase [Nonlabens xiamenensis]
MNNNYDIIIAGGGLAGLTAAILFSSQFNVLLIEPDSYPRHRLCGEYLSQEVQSILHQIDVSLDDLTEVKIKRLSLTTRNNKRLETDLPLGGYGISRYVLDQELFRKASRQAAIEQDKVLKVHLQDDTYIVKTTKHEITCKQFIMASGKRSILDKALNRPFMKRKSPWLAVKMHYAYHMPMDLVELHNFKGGYAGLSKVENDRVNLCYLTTYQSFKKQGSIEQFQDKVMRSNHALDKFFSSAEALWDKPISISQINFDPKKPVEDSIPMLGDAAGLIHPLCGNGMAMAIHSAALAHEALRSFLTGRISREQALKNYETAWKREFSSRLRTGRYLQHLLMHPFYTKTAYKILETFPGLLPKIIARTHGNISS